MSRIPTHIDDFDVEGFKVWLVEHGANVLNPTNKWEVVRYKATPTPSHKALALHIVYQKADGTLTYYGNNGQWAQKHYVDFQRGRKLGEPASERPKKAKKPRKKLKNMYPSRRRKVIDRVLARDGDDCWFCHGPLMEDITLEHLLPKSAGGSNSVKNIVLAHEECNQLAADLDVSGKVRFRDALIMLEPWRDSREALDQIRPETPERR